MFSSFHRVITVFSVAALCAALGCNGGTGYAPSRPSDPALARQTLTIALDAWKSGSATQTLAEQKPQLYVGDEDWSGGCVLKNYQLIGDGEPYGTSVRFQVGLELAEKAGSPQQKSVRYVVATNPVCSVTRDDRTE